MTAVAQLGPTAQHDAGARPMLSARLCAVVAFASIGAHLWMAWQHLHSPWQSVLMLAMAAFCLPCALKSWRHGGAGPARMLMFAALAMAAFHALLLTGAGTVLAAGTTGGGHAGHGTAAAAASINVTGAASGAAVLPHAGMMLAVVVLELLAAGAAAAYLHRLRQRL